MRRFSSYGPVDIDLHFYAPRTDLVEKVYHQLIEENPEKGGHYITVWAPRQTGKTWVMQEVIQRLKKTQAYESAIISMEIARDEKEEKTVVEILVEKMRIAFGIDFPAIEKIKDIPGLLTKRYFKAPVILVLDEFDCLDEAMINRFAGVFRDMFIQRTEERDKPSPKKTCLLHGLALIGVRSVLGIENKRGSPFNVQRSLPIPNLTHPEVEGMFKWYAQESGRVVEQTVIDRVFDETRGQPGLTCWLGELLTEGYGGYTVDNTRPIDIKEFDKIYRAAVNLLPNNNILNIIDKARAQPFRETVFQLFKTDELIRFRFDNQVINYLYTNGVIVPDIKEDRESYAKFSCPFVQKRLFNYFSSEIFSDLGNLFDSFSSLEAVIMPDRLDIRELLKLYQIYLYRNKDWLFKNAPRRSDQRIYEAVFHFNLYAYLERFLQSRNGSVYPEFPTGNGKIDLLIRYRDTTYGLELKSFSDRADFNQALTRAAQYGRQLGLKEIFLVTFLETIEEAIRQEFTVDYLDPVTQVTVKPIILQTGAL